MKKHLMVLAVVLLAVAIAMPASAAVEFKYGGQFLARYAAQDNVLDGTEFQGFYAPIGSANYWNSDDNRSAVDQRLRLYFTFQGSPNLKLVTKYEMGEAIWGLGGATTNRTGPNLGANVGGDSVSVEVKNVYLEFNIPGTPSTGLVGLQTTTLLSSWIVDDDLPAAILATKLDPFRVTVGYVGGQNGWETKFDPTGQVPTTNQQFNVDDVFAAVDYASGPFKASLIGFFQDAHSSFVSVDPATMGTPVGSFTGATSTFFTGNYLLGPVNRLNDNFLFDLGFNFTYKVDWLLAYVNFVKNFGGADIVNSAGTKLDSFDYTGYMVDAGVTYFCGPWTANVGGFYTSGPEISDNPALNNTKFAGLSGNDASWFTYPLATAKVFSEIIGGGVLGNDWGAGGYQAYRGYGFNAAASGIGGQGGLKTVYWTGYQYPTNLWTVTVGGSYQIAPQTKLSASYWYFGTAEDVPVTYNNVTNRYGMSSSIGHELDVYLDQGIVDGLTLTIVGAYLIADDAFAPVPYTATPGASLGSNFLNNHADNAYKVGARLMWNF